MPIGTSKGTNAEGAGCPPQYIKLKRKIDRGLSLYQEESS
jgi:hypothetical protein